MRAALALCVFVLLLAGCVDPDAPFPSGERSVTVAGPDSARSDASDEFPNLAEIPSDVSYRIIDGHTVHNIKRAITVRLSRKVSAEILRSLAFKLKRADPVDYQRTFIAYLLPGMENDAGCWATTHFNPDLEVSILGTTVAQEQELRRRLRNSDLEPIGVWLDDYAASQHLTVIRHDGENFLLEWWFADEPDNALTRIMTERLSSRGREFWEIDDDNPFGDHWVINAEGQLLLMDTDGLIRTLPPLPNPGVRLEPNPPTQPPVQTKPEPEPKESNPREIVRSLLERLDAIKGTPEFAKNAFGRDGVGVEWMEETRLLRIKFAGDPEAAKALRALSRLALDYSMSDGSENSSTRAFRTDIEGYLTSS